jgi:hypothetical protein
MLGMRLLKIRASNLIAWNLRGDGKHRNTTALAVIETIDQMQIAGTATPRADSKLSGKMCLRASSERGRFFMSHVNPLNLLLLSNRVGDPVEESPETP